MGLGTLVPFDDHAESGETHSSELAQHLIAGT
ncbi:hypothetical protein Poly21_29170 [Allorhodopirellula heiligendammensis]|uniref:Uncharacterized protein n=1 Tax=Allorhodopirellula heiligendammensis TaxID=2714739 RepID=A0A5C6BU05_9BACT|nr:hypothetical protein Poly21_29170 [Allorhodopirellula heiligendammensis]